MYRGQSKYFKVVYNPREEFSVWHADAALLDNWRETGRYGSVSDCWDYIDTRELDQGYLFKLISGD
jgi:uncharacterized protein YbdZ (MbtH family)